MTGAPDRMREQPVMLMPSLVQHVAGDVEVAWLLQRVKDHGGLDIVVHASTEQLAQMLYLSPDQVEPILARALTTGCIVDHAGPPAPWGPHMLRLVVSL